MHRVTGVLVLILTLSAALRAGAYDGVVDKKVFSLPSYTTVGGVTIT